MAEYIDRQAAIDSLLGWAEQLTETYGKNDEYVLCLQSAAYNIEQIPATDVRPVRRGKWTLNKDGSGTCSECGRTQKNCWDLDNWDNFCHFCGADMRTTT